MTTIFPSFHSALNTSAVYYDQYIEHSAYGYRVTQILLFVGFLIFTILLYAIGFKSIVNRLNKEAKRTKAMILMIPESVVLEVEEIQAYLLATHGGEDDEDDQF
jgi:hypothetical protein